MKFFDAFVDNARTLTGKNASDLDVETVASREFTDAEAAFYGTVMNAFKENPQCEVDFTEWDPTEPAEVPFGLSKASNASKIQPHVAMAACNGPVLLNDFSNNSRGMSKRQHKQRLMDARGA